MEPRVRHIDTIAVDGPAGSGKSTLGKRLATRLGFLFFDTGVLYRAVACVSLKRGIDVNDEASVCALAKDLRIDLPPPSAADGRDNDLLADGQDITWAIRSPEVDASVSVVAAYPGVRSVLIDQQRRIGLSGEVVMVGRDIGTVVLPEADLKIYLDASAEERARRRFDERTARGESPQYEQILASILERDRIDSSRTVAPLRPADDAVVLDTDSMSIEEVLEVVLGLVEQYRAGSDRKAA